MNILCFLLILDLDRDEMELRNNKNRDGNIRVARVGRKKEIKRKLILFVFF
jgi:hypothetical protein